MTILPATDSDFSLIQDFLLPYESSCVTLCSNVRRKKAGVYVIKEGPILGVLFVNKTLLYCIPKAETYDSRLEEALSNFLKDKPLSCLNGEAKAGEVILQALQKLGLKPYQTNHYITMTLESSPLPAPESLSCDDEIKRCTAPETDTELLLPLQKMYIAKEVAPAGKQVSDLEVSASLKSILKNQLCFALWSDGEIVAKANTNAIGFNYVQLGGVYTHPLYRKNYYAWHLVYTICSRVLKSQRKISLFVKEKNNPAHELYQRIGFVQSGRYEIAYF